VNIKFIEWSLHSAFIYSHNLTQEMLSLCFCFLVLELSSSKDFNLFFIAAIFAVRLVCPMAPPPPMRSILCPSLAAFVDLSAVSNKHFSPARRTTSGRPQANLPCIFSLANSASCILTLTMEIRNCQKLAEVMSAINLPLLCYTGWKQNHVAPRVSGHACAIRSPQKLSFHREKTFWAKQLWKALKRKWENKYVSMCMNHRTKNQCQVLVASLHFSLCNSKIKVTNIESAFTLIINIGILHSAIHKISARENWYGRYQNPNEQF